MYIYIYIYISYCNNFADLVSSPQPSQPPGCDRPRAKKSRRTDSVYHHHHHRHHRHRHLHHHHHHPEGVVYRSLCLNSSTVAVSEMVSRRWWCVENLSSQSRHRLDANLVMQTGWPHLGRGKVLRDGKPLLL